MCCIHHTCIHIKQFIACCLGSSLLPLTALAYAAIFSTGVSHLSLFWAACDPLGSVRLPRLPLCVYIGNE